MGYAGEKIRLHCEKLVFLYHESKHENGTKNDGDEGEKQKPVHQVHFLPGFLADFLHVFFVKREFPGESIGYVELG